MKRGFLFNFMTLILVIAGIIIGFSISQSFGGSKIDEKIKSTIYGDYTPKQIPNSTEEIKQNCKNLNVFESSKCVRDNLKTFYKYKINNEDYFDIETLKEKGGDCYNYAKFYEDIFIEMGMGAKAIYIEGGDMKHEFTIVFDENGYCVVDMLEIKCMVINNE